MQVYVSRRNEEVTGKLVKENEKFKTVELELLTGEKAGSIISITSSTLKRWWKVIESEDVAEVVMEQEKEPEIEIPVINSENVKVVDTESELTDEQYAKIGLEIFEQAKEKSRQYTKANSISVDLSAITSSVELKYVPSNKSNIRVISSGKTVAELFIRKSFIFVCTRKAVEGFDLYIKSYRPYPNYHKATTIEQVNKIIEEMI